MFGLLFRNHGMILLFLLLLPGCFSFNLAVLYGEESTNSSSLKLSRLCRMYDIRDIRVASKCQYLVVSGISRENIVVLVPSVRTSNNSPTVNSFKDLQNVVSQLSPSKTFMSSCWSHINYVGPSVNINLLISVIQGDMKRAASLSGQREPRVLSVCLMKLLDCRIIQVINCLSIWSVRVATKLFFHLKY